jgi:hypothetical protein
MEKKKKKVRADIRFLPREYYEGNEIMKWRMKFNSKKGKEAAKKGFG